MFLLSSIIIISPFIFCKCQIRLFYAFFKFYLAISVNIL